MGFNIQNGCLRHANLFLSEQTLVLVNVLLENILDISIIIYYVKKE